MCFPRLRRTALTIFAVAGVSASLGCGEDPAGPPAPDPGATLAAISPVSAPIGWPGLSLHVAGANFIPGSTIAWSGAGRTTVFNNAELLTAEIPASDLAVQGTFRVTVILPDGDIAANEATFQVLAPLPTLSSLSTIESPVNEPLVLDLLGGGFYEGSVVRVGGVELAPEFVSETKLVVSLGAEHVSPVGPIDVVVRNPEPGGGESDTLELTVIPATPGLVNLSSEGASAGRPGFELQVFGSGFRPTTQAFLNGETRPTMFVSHEQLVVTVFAGDVASPNTIDVTVENPPPSGPAPSSLQLEVRSVGPAVVESLSGIEMPANDLAYSHYTGLLYASIGSGGGTLGNTVAAIDPMSGSVVNSVFVGSEPGSVAVSDDGRYLWVALDGSGMVRGVDLATFLAGPPFSVVNGFAEEIAVAPGTQRTVAVSHRSADSSPRYAGVRIYDDGIPRPDGDPEHTRANSIDFNDAGDAIYGYDNETSNFWIYTLSVDPRGVQRAKATAGVIGSFYTRIVHANGRIYSNAGEVIDARRHLLVGNLGQASEAIGIDAELGRAFLLIGNSIEALDINNFQSLGTLPVPNETTDHLSFHKRRVVRWGSDGLAYRDGVKVYLVRTPVAGQ